MTPRIAFDCTRIDREDIEKAGFGGAINVEGDPRTAIMLLDTPQTIYTPPTHSNFAAGFLCGLAIALAFFANLFLATLAF